MAAQGDDCYFYYYSTCSKGDSCQFRHCQEALGNEVVCSLWREGRCHRTICYYRHMEIDKNRSVIPCYWESQPTGCLKQHCPFKHMKPRGLDTASWASSPTKLTTDVRNTLTSGGSVPVKKAVPPPVVEPVVVTAGEESDETSSVEVSPVKKLKFPTSSLLSSVKEEEQKSSEAGELNFGIKTLSQIREKNPREYKSLQNTTIVAGGQPGDQRKIVSLKGTSSSLPEGDKLSSVDQSGVALEKEGPTVLAKKRQRITFNTGEKTSLTTRRKLITSETEEKPVVISLNSGKDGAVKMEEDSSTEIKSLSQIRQERFQRSIQLKKLGLAGQGDGGIKTLAQIRREKKAKLGMKIAEQGDAAIVGRVENMETEKMSKEESGIGDGSDYGVKSLDEIRKERLLKYSSGEGDGDVTGVKSLEQIRRERIANRLGLKTDKENSVTSATVETDSQNKTLRTSVLSRLGKSESQNTVHQRLTPLVKNDSHTERGRKIQLKEPREIQSLQSDSQLLSQKIVSVKPEVTKSSEEPVVKTKKRRVFVMGNADETDGQVEKTADEKEDEEVNRSLPKSRIRVGRLAMDGAAEKDRPLRASEDSEESENNAAKEETKSKRILIKRNEGKLTKPLKRRADRQIYQPPGAKSERASSIRSRLGQNTETEKFDEENKDGEEEKNKEIMVRKRPRITFHTDATSDLAESNNSQKNADSRLSNAETSEGRKTIKSGTVRIRPVPKSPKEEPEHSEPQPPKKIKGGGLRERLLKQSEKFTVGVVGGKLDSTSLKPQASGSEGKNTRRHIASEHVVGDSVKGPASGRVEPAEVSIGVKTFQETHDSRTDLGLAEGEQTVVSSSESSVLSDRHLEDTEKRIPDVGNVGSIPSNLSLSITSETKSVSPSNSILPDSTNQIIPSVEVGQPKTISSSQPLEANTNEPGTGGGKVQKEPNSRSSKARMSITDDDLDNLLDDVDDIGGPDQFEDDDDDALLNELEDLINA